MKKNQILTLDSLTNECGYFSNEKTAYGCNHKKCGDTIEFEKGKYTGRCFSWSCPFAYEIDIEDLTDKEMKELSLDKTDFDKDGQQLGSFGGDMYMRIYKLPCKKRS